MDRAEVVLAEMSALSDVKRDAAAFGRYTCPHDVSRCWFKQSADLSCCVAL